MEFKVTRLLPLMAAGAFIVSERMGMDQVRGVTACGGIGAATTGGSGVALSILFACNHVWVCGLRRHCGQDMALYRPGIVEVESPSDPGPHLVNPEAVQVGAHFMCCTAHSANSCVTICRWSAWFHRVDT